jgi:hypothetical protein
MTSKRTASNQGADDDTALPDPGNAPAPGDAPEISRKTPPPTSRALWLATYVAVLVFLALRLPQTYEHLRRNIPAGMSAEINDKDMEALALRIGLFLGLIMTALIFGMLFVGSAILEKKIFPARKTVRGRLTFGLYFLVISLCVVPPQVASVIFGIPVVKGAVLYLYVATVGLLAPALFYGEWRKLPTARIAAVFATSLGLAAFTSIG